MNAGVAELVDALEEDVTFESAHFIQVQVLSPALKTKQTDENKLGQQFRDSRRRLAASAAHQRGRQRG